MKIIPNRTMFLDGRRVEQGKVEKVKDSEGKLAIRHGWAVEAKGDAEKAAAEKAAAEKAAAEKAAAEKAAAEKAAAEKAAAKEAAGEKSGGDAGNKGNE